jgi:uncharacterized protein (DUF1697 family)
MPKSQKRAVVLLRGVNVGGKTLRMADFMEVLKEVGCAEPQTLLQSGNAVFVVDAREPAAIETAIERALASRFALASDTFVRTAEEWAAIVSANPFPKEAATDPAHLIMIALKAAPTAATVKAVEAAIAGREVVRAVGRQLYVVYPDGMGRSKLTGAIIERKLGTRGTARNWNTVLKLASLVDPSVDAH